MGQLSALVIDFYHLGPQVTVGDSNFEFAIKLSNVSSSRENKSLVCKIIVRSSVFCTVL